MANFVFETMTQAQATAFLAGDNLFFLGTTAAQIAVSHRDGDPLNTEALILASGARSLTFVASQLSGSSLAGLMVFNDGGGLVIGTDAAQDLNLSATSGGTSIAYGFGGADTLRAGVADDMLFGGDGDDLISGFSATIDGHGDYIENDFYNGGGGNDTINGSDGNDHLYGNAWNATPGSPDGADQLHGGDGNDYIQGNGDADWIYGEGGNDRLYGGADDDHITGGTGLDYIQGNKGADNLQGNDGEDTIRGGADDDTLSGGADADSLAGDAGNDRLNGDDGNDIVLGGAGADTLRGDAGDDWVDGGDGADVVSGGGGLDRVTGGAGNDIFDFRAPGDATPVISSGVYFTDEVLDYTDGVDEFRLNPGDLAAVLTANGASFETIAAARLYAQQLINATVSSGSEVVAIAIGGDTYLFYGAAGGDTVAIDSIVKVDNVAPGAFTVADFNV